MAETDRFITPMVWAGLPDLRDGSPDLEIWGMHHIRRPLASKLMNCSMRLVNKMFDQGQIEKTWFWGRPGMRLQSLPQTARCLWVESLFMPDMLMESKNYLYKSSDVCKVTGISSRTLIYMTGQGQMTREVLPSFGYRDPHWGMDQDVAAKVREVYLNS